jgi:peptidoglycan/LPS O-acetylase OafA/YrhL
VAGRRASLGLDAGSGATSTSGPGTSGVPGYLPALDGLRAVAVAAVVAYHLGELRGGFLGVDVFFVISGFLITRLLLAERERTGRVALGAFWVRRFKRLLPALMVVLVAVVAGSRLWLPAWRLADIRLDALSALAYVANWRFVLSGQSYFDSGVVPSPLRHTWSLSIEEQFYVVWPLVAIVVLALATRRSWRGRRAIGAVAALGAVASAVWMAVLAARGGDLSRIYYGTDTRAFALLVGVWLASWWDPATARPARAARRAQRARRWSTAGAVAVVPALALFVIGSTDEVAFYQGGFQSMAVVSVLLVAGVASGTGPLVAVLGHRVLVWVGRRSYGIYLWSWPVQVFGQEHAGWDGAVLITVTVVASVALAALSHWLVEEPVRTGRRPAGIGRPPSMAPSPALATAASTSGRGHRLPWPVAPVVAVLVVVGSVTAITSGAPAAPEYTRVSDEDALAAVLGDDFDPTATTASTVPPTTTTTSPLNPGPPGPFTGRAVTYVVRPAASVDPAVRLGRPLKVMIAGDSVGWSLAWLLGPELTPSVQVSGRALLGCGILPWESKFVVRGRDPEQYPDLCANADAAELDGLERSPDVVLLWIGAWEVYDHEIDGVRYRVGTPAFAQKLEERIQLRVDRYKAAGVPTVISLVPCFAQNAARLGTERLDPERVAWVNDRIRTVAKQNRGWVRLVDPTAQLCDTDGNPFGETPEGDPLREDGSHFDPPAARWFWNTWLADQLGAAFDVSR